MGHIILVGSDKGGTGKTTISVNLAAMCATAGMEVLLVDADEQGSATGWASTRSFKKYERNLEPDMVCIAKRGKLGLDIEKLKPKFEIIIIDAAGKQSVELRQAMAVSDIHVMPIRPSQFDMWTMNTMMETIDGVQQQTGEKHNYKCVINAAHSNPSVKEAEEATAQILETYPEIDFFSTPIRDRVVFRKASREGMGVVEMPRPGFDPSANLEIGALYQEIFGHEWQVKQ